MAVLGDNRWSGCGEISIRLARDFRQRSSGGPDLGLRGSGFWRRWVSLDCCLRRLSLLEKARASAGNEALLLVAGRTLGVVMRLCDWSVMEILMTVFILRFSPQPPPRRARKGRDINGPISPGWSLRSNPRPISAAPSAQPEAETERQGKAGEPLILLIISYLTRIAILRQLSIRLLPS